ncbi:DUF6350 family protein [Actinotalea sp. AC32]|nr:DUF6350 family protein [Actinotalea sp. AC32]
MTRPLPLDLLRRVPVPYAAAVRARLARTARGPAPQHWVSGVLAGVQAALLSLLVVVMPAMAAYVVTSADPSNADVGWLRSVVVGSVVWLLGHGATVSVGGTPVTVVALGVTLLSVFVCHASARRSAHPTTSAWAGATAGYVAVAVVVLAAVGEAGPSGAGAGSVLRTLAGAALVALVGTGTGTRRIGPAVRSLLARLPDVARVGVVGGVVATASLVAAAALVSVWWGFSGRATTGDVLAGLRVDAFGGVMLAVAQLAVTPNLVLWALAWIAGPGFAVGEGTRYSPAVVEPAALPALPLLGSLPTPAASGGLFTWAPVLVVVAGAVAGWWVHRELRPTRAWHGSVTAVSAAASAGLLATVLTALGAGAAGPGRLAVVGGSPALVGASVASLVLAGLLVVVLPLDRPLRAAVRARAAGLRATAASRATTTGPGAGPAGPAGGSADEVGSLVDVPVPVRAPADEEPAGPVERTT